MEDTVFAKVVRREIPADIVYEDEDTLAFLDIAPANPGHTLVVPKNPARNIFDIQEKDWLAVMRTVRRIAEAVRDAVGAEGVNVSINNEPAAGQTVFYTHVHIIPRYSNDGLGPWAKKEYKKGEREEIAEKIRAELA